MTVVTYAVSDLARRRRQVVDAARAEPVRIRDTDGTLLVLTTDERERNLNELLRLHQLAIRADTEVRAADKRGEAPNPTALGELSFLADLETEERRYVLDGFHEALVEAMALTDPYPAIFYIDWARPTGKPTPAPVKEQVLAELGARLAAARPQST